MTTAYFAAQTDTDGYEPFAAGKIKYLRRDDVVTAGIWVVSPEDAPEVVEIPFAQHESLVVLEGRLKIEVVDGPTFEFGPGDSGSFTKGTVARWHILEPLRKFFVYS